MSPRGLVLLLVVGLCATQAASTTELSRHDRLRHERGVQELLAAAKEKLTQVLVAAEDAARASVETVWQYVQQLEAGVLRAGTNTLHSYGYEVNLTTIAELVKSDIKICFADLGLKEPLMDVMMDLTSCISKDRESLKLLIKNMQAMWVTAQTLPDTMVEVTNQCSEHAEHESEVPEDVLGQLLDHSDHDLASRSNELLHEASRTMSKRSLWSFGRVYKCVRSVYSLTKGDLMNIPGQIVASAASAYKVSRAASGGMQTCVSLRMTENMPTIISVTADLGTCMAKMNLEEVAAEYPFLVGLEKLVEAAKKIQDFQNNPMNALHPDSDEVSGGGGYLSYLPGGESIGRALGSATHLASYLWG